jgi:hypothetical protein
VSADTPAGSLALLTSARLHDDEPDTGAGVARALLRSQIPRLVSRRLELLTNTGADRAGTQIYL